MSEKQDSKLKDLKEEESDPCDLHFFIFVMGWRYRAGLFLISAVVIIWVTSAEVTQVCL